MPALRVFRLALDRPGASPVEVSPDEADSKSALIWVDVRAGEGVAGLEDALEQLSQPRLTAEFVAKLAQQQVPGASAERIVLAADITAAHDAHHPVRLSAAPLAVVAGSEWVLTVRGASHLVAPEGAPAPPPTDLATRIMRRWHPWPSAASDDLAISILLELVGGWAVALGELASRQAELERDYLEAHGADVAARAQAASALQGELALLRRQLLAVDREVRRLARPGRDPVSAWFRAHKTESEAEQVAAIVDAGRAQLNTLLESQRSTLHLIAGRAAVEQLQVADIAARRGQALQGLVAWLTGVLLLPTLVATVFGALPAVLEDCPAGRLALVVGTTLATMLGGGIAAWCLVGFPVIRPKDGAQSS